MVSLDREIRSPWDGALAGTVRDAAPEDVEAAVRAARFGADAMASLPLHRRAEILAGAAGWLQSRLEEQARLITAQVAKPIADARTEVARAVRTLNVAAEEAGRLVGEVVPLEGSPGGEGKVAWTSWEPVGVVAAVTPFNFPLNLVAHKVGPALAAGNSVIVKPAPSAPLSALALRDALVEAGAPAGAVQVLTGGADAAVAIAAHPGVDYVTFTGSVLAGNALRRLADGRRVTLEMGNAGAALVEPDADLDRVIARCVPAGYSFSGQVCISLQRLYVHREVLEETAGRFVEAVRTLPVGDPMQEETRVSALISLEAAERVEAWVREAANGGAAVLCGGTRDGLVVTPTVLGDPTPDARVTCDEVFGPVVSLYAYDDYREAIDRVNATPFGLQASVFTRDIGKAMTAARRLKAGSVLVNEAPSFRLDAMPYGGVKASGVGREGPRYAARDMSEAKLVILHTE